MLFFLFFRNQLLRTPDASDLVVVLATIFNRCVHLMVSITEPPLVSQNTAHYVDDMIYECGRLLRNSCALDKHLQMQLANSSMNEQSVFQAINAILMSNDGSVSSRTRKMCWQLLANLGVQNEMAQLEIWSKCIKPLMDQLKCVCCTGGNGRECTMIIYNLMISENLCANDVRRIVEILLECVCNHDYQHEWVNNDFHQLFMEHIITKYRSIVPVYDRIVPHEKRLHLIYYIADHMKAVRHDTISTPLLQFMCREFKKKSDCVLRTAVGAAAAIDTIHPKEVVALLDVIAQASSDERYAHVLATDNSLFINVGCLLRSIHDLGKRQMGDSNDENIFAPIQKLTQLAPNSNENTQIERDISYQLKSTLIRTLANLVYKNKEKQDLASEWRDIHVNPEIIQSNRSVFVWRFSFNSFVVLFAGS